MSRNIRLKSLKKWLLVCSFVNEICSTNKRQRRFENWRPCFRKLLINFKIAVAIQRANDVTPNHHEDRSSYGPLAYRKKMKIPCFLIQFLPLNSFHAFMYCNLWISNFKKEQLPQKLFEEIGYRQAGSTYPDLQFPALLPNLQF